MSKILHELAEEVEELGFVPGTPAFERALCAAKVTKCKEIRNVFDCAQCSQVEHCQLVKQHRMNEVLKIRSTK